MDARSGSSFPTSSSKGRSDNRWLRWAVPRARLAGRLRRHWPRGVDLARTWHDATRAVAEENLVVEAGEDSAQPTTPSGKHVSGGCERSLQHCDPLPTRCSR